MLPDDATGRPIRLGDFLPDLEILFKDSAGNAVEYWGNVHLKITCPQLTVLCDQIESEWDFEVLCVVLIFKTQIIIPMLDEWRAET